MKPSFVGAAAVRWATWFLVCLGALVALPGMMSGNFLPKSAWAALSIGIGLLLCRRNTDNVIRITTLGATWGAYLAWALFSTLWAPSPQAVMGRGMMFLIPTLGYLLATRSRFWESRAFWSAFSVLVGIVGLIGLLQYILADFPLDNWYQGTAIPRSTMGQRNYASMFIMITSPFLFLFWYRFRGIKALLALLAGILALFFLLLARTRGAWLGAAGGMIFAIVLGAGQATIVHRKKTIILLAVILGTLLAGLILHPSDKTNQLIGKKRDLGKIAASVLDPQQRLNFWMPCLGVTPVIHGAGFGNFPIPATPMIMDGSVKTLNWEVHNDYLQAFVDLGVVGLTLFCLFCVLLIRAAWRRKHTGLGMAAGAASMALLIMQFTTFTSEKTCSLIWMAGVVAILNSPEREKPLFSISIPFWFKRCGTIGGGILGILLSITIGLSIRGDYSLHHALESTSKAIVLRNMLAEEKDPEQARRISASWQMARSVALDELEVARATVLPFIWYDPNMCHIYLHQLAELAFKIDAPYQADWLAREGLRLHPNDRTCLTILAYNALREGRLTEGEELLERGYRTFGPNPYIPFFPDKLADLLEKQGRKSEADHIRQTRDKYKLKQPANPSPPNWGRDIALNPVFSWEEGSRETKYDLYLWKTRQKHPEQPRLRDLDSCRGELSEPLEPETVYLWRIRCLGRFSEQTGPIWSFRTGP